MRALRRAALALLAWAPPAAAASDRRRRGDDGTTGRRRTTAAGCSPGGHALTLRNGQAAQMLVTPGERCERRSWSSSTAPEERPQSGLEAFRGAWDEPGLVLIAPESKGHTWSLLRSEQDLDLVSVNLALAEAYERCEIDRRRIAVGGFSDGATYALTLGLSNGDLFPAIMALSPGGIIGGQAGRRPAGLRRSRHGRHVLPIERAGDAVVKQAPRRRLPVEYRRFRGGHEASTRRRTPRSSWFLEGAP